jgi:hypothetical protein
MRLCLADLCIFVSVTLAALGATAGDAGAQAWVGERGEIGLGLDYNLGISSKVVGAEEEFLDAGTTAHQLALGAEYVPLDKLAVSLTLPVVALKYTGDRMTFPHPGGGSYDDGKYHTTLTDLRLGARYQVLAEPVALSPHIGASIPLADYETVGNTVAGRQLLAAHLGIGVGRVFGAATYVHLMYELSLAEKYDRTPETARYGQSRSDVSLTVGHKLMDQRLDLHVDVNARVHHDGIDLESLADVETPPDVRDFHDAILEERIVLAGGGVGYQVTDRLALSLSGRVFVTGANTQAASVIALGIAWSPR